MAAALTFQCAFCRTGITDDDIEPLQLLVLESRQWQTGANSTPERPTQGLFAHVDCLASRLHDGVPFLDHAERREGKTL